jgi:hypothetical protein
MNKDAIQVATKRLAIAMVYQGGSDTKLHNDFDPLLPGQELTSQFRIGTEGVERKDLCVDDVHQHFIRFRVSAEMRYLKISSNSELNEDNLSELIVAEINVLFIAELCCYW